MHTQRVDKVLALLRKHGIHQMLLTDMNSIFYLTGQMIYSGSRLMALLIRGDGGHRLFLNRLYAAKEDPDLELVRFSDTDDAIALVGGYVDHSTQLGIDRKMTAGHLLALQKLGAASGYQDTSDCVDAVRSRKDPEEQQKMLAASQINDHAMAEFKGLIRPGVSERDIARQMEEIYRSLGADGLSFHPVVSFGANAANPHHKPDDTILKEGDCVLFDVGCKKDAYCADMTRTFFYKWVSPEAQAVYDVVRQANLAGESIIRPGVRFCDVDRAARSVIEAVGYGPNFTHRLGHSIGLDLHEPGDANSVNTSLVEEGNIFSCEPGIYLPGQFGIRIEDLCLVTADGVMLLNASPKELEAIE